MQALLQPGHLEIHDARREEVYRDIVRIPEADRVNSAGMTIAEGHICRTSGSQSAYVIVRGVKGFDVNGHGHGRCIHTDEMTRKRLGVNEARSARFDFSAVGFWGGLRWAWGATEIGYRVASRLGLIGLLVGLIALPGVISDAVKLIRSTIGISSETAKLSALSRTISPQ